VLKPGHPRGADIARPALQDYVKNSIAPVQVIRALVEFVRRLAATETGKLQRFN